MPTLQELSGRLSNASRPALDQARSRLSKARVRVGTESYFVAVGIRAGMVGRETPRRLAAVARVLCRYGLLGGSLASAAIRHPEQAAVIDERGAVSYRELDEHVNSIAGAWAARGLRAGEGVAVMTRNHRGFVEAMMAAAKGGCRIILLNTGFSAPQVQEVVAREGAQLLVYDDEFEACVSGVELPHGRYRAWTEPAAQASDATLDSLIASHPPTPPPKPSVAPRIVILTSGTTGTPKGAGRKVPVSLSPIGGALSRVPFRGGQVTEISAPLFHALGFSQLLLAVGLHSTMVLHRRFDARQLLDSIERHRVEALVLVPVMLQRLLALEPEELAARDLSSLRIIYLSGSQLGAALAQRAAAAFGPVLYNLYGSTEIAYATIATPEDLAAAPACVGRVARGAVVRIIDDDGHELPTGRTGRIFVGNLLEFEGYTGGDDKERLGALVASGDVGHFDEAGRLFIDGRDDEMIISGGENVFPREVEDLLAAHPAVLETAALGVDDEQFGQRLRVFVVPRSGMTLAEDEVREYVRSNLARYKVPRDVVFLDALPRNPTGKVLKRELRGQII